MSNTTEEERLWTNAYKSGWDSATKKTMKFVDDLDSEFMDTETLKKCVMAFLTGLKFD